MNMKTDYVDAQFSGERKYNISDNADGTKSIEDATSYSVVGDKFGAKDINETNAAINRVARVLSAVLPASGWSGSAPFKQTISVAGVTADDILLLALDRDNSAYSGTSSGNRAKLQSEFGYIDSLDSGAGKVTFTCMDYRPSMNIPIKMRGC